MEKLQDPINPCLIGEELDVGWLEEFVSNIGSNYKFEDSYFEEGYDTTQTNHSLPSLEDKMPFLQMLQGVEFSQPTIPFMQETNYFQLLMRMQHQKMTMMENHKNNFTSNFTSPSELESCVTNINNNDIIMNLHSPVKSENFREEQAQISPKKSQGRLKGSQLVETSSHNNLVGGVTMEGFRERRKRKRPIKVTKNKEEVETQRRTHIAVERNRRRQMNEHLNALRSLMPPSYVQRGDQASIIGGAIDYVKEMEQLLQSLQAQKRMRHHSDENADVSATSSTSSSSNLFNNMLMTSPTSPFQLKNFSPNEESNGISTEVRRNNNEEFSAENRSALADIKVIVIQNHVNLKIQCQRRPGQLLRAIMAFEELKLTILHLNITSLHTLVHYSFNLKIEDGCTLGSADEIIRAVHHIFSLINLT